MICRLNEPSDGPTEIPVGHPRSTDRPSGIGLQYGELGQCRMTVHSTHPFGALYCKADSGPYLKVMLVALLTVPAEQGPVLEKGFPFHGRFL